MRTKYCSRCGSIIEDGAEFCGECGARVTDATDVSNYGFSGGSEKETGLPETEGTSGPFDQFGSNAAAPEEGTAAAGMASQDSAAGWETASSSTTPQNAAYAQQDSGYAQNGYNGQQQNGGYTQGGYNGQQNGGYTQGTNYGQQNGGYINGGGFQQMNGPGTPIPPGSPSGSQKVPALILGIVSIVFALILPLITYICGGIGLVFVSKAKQNGENATPAMICCIIGLVLAVINSIMGVILALSAYM